MKMYFIEKRGNLHTWLELQMEVAFVISLLPENSNDFQIY